MGILNNSILCACVCVCACVRACVRASERLCNSLFLLPLTPLCH